MNWECIVRSCDGQELVSGKVEPVYFPTNDLLGGGKRGGAGAGAGGPADLLDRSSPG